MSEVGTLRWVEEELASKNRSYSGLNRSADATNPAHYRTGSIECIDAIRASMSEEEFIGYLKGNVMKYIWRAEKKHPDRPAEDLKKAKWYLNGWISTVEPQDSE